MSGTGGDSVNNPIECRPSADDVTSSLPSPPHVLTHWGLPATLWDEDYCDPQFPGEETEARREMPVTELEVAESVNLDSGSLLRRRGPGSSQRLSSGWQAGTAAWPPSQLAARDPRPSRGRGGGRAAQLGLAGEKERAAAGRPEAFPVSRRWKGSPHQERTPSSVVMAGSEVSPSLVHVRIHCLTFNSFPDQLLEVLMTVCSQNNTQHCFFQPRSAESRYLPTSHWRPTEPW